MIYSHIFNQTLYFCFRKITFGKFNISGNNRISVELAQVLLRVLLLHRNIRSYSSPLHVSKDNDCAEEAAAAAKSIGNPVRGINRHRHRDY
jgi:phosphoribosylpyrophosphate synthetase